MVFADAVLVEVDVFGAFECDGGGPVDGGFVIVVDGDAFRRVGEAEVDGAVFDAEEIVDAFVGGINLGDAGAVCGLILPDDLPGDGAASTTDDVAGKGAVLE